MKCSLSAIVQDLKADFPLEICGDIQRSISDVQLMRTDSPADAPDVLYVVHQDQLLQYEGPPARGAVLCISRTGWELGNSRAVFPVLIWVLCPEPSRVYSALGRYLYQEGSRVSDMPEISGAFLRCRSLDALVAAGYTYLENPFAIHDSDGKLVAYSRQAGFRHASWQTPAFLESLCDFSSVDNAAAMEQSRRDQTPVLLGGTPPQLRMALSSRGQTLGYLTVLGLFRSFTHKDRQVMELLGCFVTLDLLRQNSITRTSVSEAGRLKSYLESGEIPDIPRWLEGQVCQTGEAYSLLLINNSPQSPLSFLEVEPLLEQLDQQFPEDIATRIESGVVLLLKLPCKEQDAGWQAVEEFFAAHRGTLAVGVSMPFTALGESGHAALRQARTALELGCVLRPEAGFYPFRDYSVYAGLRAASYHMDLRELIPTGLMALVAADPGGESIRTLEVYLSTGGKKAHAAELLFIHLNTLKYRLGQIAQRLGADLDDPETMFSLRYALRVLEYIRCFGNGTS